MKTASVITQEFESSWRALTLILMLLDNEASTEESGFPPDSEEPPTGASLCSRNLQPLIGSLLFRLAKATGAQQAVLSVYHNRHRYVVHYPPSCRPTTISLCEESVFSPLRLASPVLAENEVVVQIDVRVADDGMACSTLHKKLVRAVAHFLGLYIARERMCDTTQTFTASLSLHHRLENMIHKVWEVTENRQETRDRTFEAVGRAVAKAIPSSAASIVLWDEQGTMFPMFSAGESADAVSALQRIVRSEAEEHLQSGFLFVRSALAEDARAIHENRDASPLTAMIMVPLTRLKRWKGVLTLGRAGRGAEFNTIEKRALHIVSGLLGDPERVPAA